MPLLALEMKANLVNVTDLHPSEPESFRWHMKVKCSNCGEQPNTWHYVVINEEMDVPGSRGEAHLVEKCKLCGRQNTLAIITDSVRAYCVEKNEEWQPMIKFDCRGIEPVDFDPRMGWKCEGAESGAIFDDVDLSEKEWSDYDERVSEATEINEMSFRFVHAKK